LETRHRTTTNKTQKIKDEQHGLVKGNNFLLLVRHPSPSYSYRQVTKITITSIDETYKDRVPPMSEGRRGCRYQSGIRIRKSKKIRQHNGQQKKYKRTNNDFKNIHIKLKIE
jgi:hypothetical protein